MAIPSLWPCLKKKCKGKLVDQTVLGMGPSWKCPICETKYDHFGRIYKGSWLSKEDLEEKDDIRHERGRCESSTAT